MPSKTSALEELGLAIDLVPPRYRSTYFNHIFSDPAGVILRAITAICGPKCSTATAASGSATMAG